MENNIVEIAEEVFVFVCLDEAEKENKGHIVNISILFALKTDSKTKSVKRIYGFRNRLLNGGILDKQVDTVVFRDKVTLD